MKFSSGISGTGTGPVVLSMFTSTSEKRTVEPPESVFDSDEVTEACGGWEGGNNFARPKIFEKF